MEEDEIKKKRFEEWMVEADKTLMRNVGISIYDLPDQTYRDWFDEGMSAGKAAYKALRNSGGDLLI